MRIKALPFSQAERSGGGGGGCPAESVRTAPGPPRPKAKGLVGEKRGSGSKGDPVGACGVSQWCGGKPQQSERLEKRAQSLKATR